tara:strand:- start:2074 stop:2208 length:135 start_codon:yes stop_codon:yes gene_type:complete
MGGEFLLKNMLIVSYGAGQFLNFTPGPLSSLFRSYLEFPFEEEY